MGGRQIPRIVTDPKVRQVGFFAPGIQTNISQLFPSHAGVSSPPLSDVSASVNSMSPVMIPPPLYTSTGLSRHADQSIIQGANGGADSSVLPGSYNPSEFQSSAATTEFIDEALPHLLGRGKGSEKFSNSLPIGSFDIELTKQDTVITLPADTQGKKVMSVKPLKEKTSKAERRSIQEAQRAAKAAARGEGSKGSTVATVSVSVANAVNPNTGNPSKVLQQKKQNLPTGVSESRIVDHQPSKDKKKDVPHPRMQFDDSSRVQKAKRRSFVEKNESKNRVELFRHLPQYEHGAWLPDLESKLFKLDTVHPVIYKVGLRYLAGDISGGNARCIAMLQGFQEFIKNYSTPPDKSLIRDLTAKINGNVSFLSECRPLSVSMGNVIRFLKAQISKLPLHLSETEAKAKIVSDIDRFIMERIILAVKAIMNHAVTKITDGDVLLTYASSSTVEMILLHAHELGKKFRVVVVDSRPKLEGKKLLTRLIRMGIPCTYTHINAVSYIMPEVTRVILGASSILSNGMVYSRVGTACVAMVANQYHVPVLICCEAYKFHERVQLDSICFNELGDPDVISKVPGRKEVSYPGNWSSTENLQLLNLSYDATPPDYVSMIITDFGMIPPTSVAVIVREHLRENLWT